MSDCEDVLTEIESTDASPTKVNMTTDVKVASMGTQGANQRELTKQDLLGVSKSVTWAPIVSQLASTGKTSASKLLQARDFWLKI